MWTSFSILVASTSLLRLHMSPTMDLLSMSCLMTGVASLPFLSRSSFI